MTYLPISLSYCKSLAMWSDRSTCDAISHLGGIFCVSATSSDKVLTCVSDSVIRFDSWKPEYEGNITGLLCLPVKGSQTWTRSGGQCCSAAGPAGQRRGHREVSAHTHTVTLISEESMNDDLKQKREVGTHR